MTSDLLGIFLNGRTATKFDGRPVDDATLRRLYDVYKWGPTSLNSQPGRILFLRSPEEKARLAAALAPSNVEKTMTAPVVAIVAYDTRFHELLPTQAPHLPAAVIEKLAADPALHHETAFRNSSLQGAFLIVAARMLGLDAGPMSGFDARKVDETFFPGGRWKSNFLVNLGYADPGRTRPRGPRLDFEQATRVL